MNHPKELKYAKTHEYTRREGRLARIGITDFAQNELGDVVYVELPQAGRVVHAGEAVAVIESVKTASDVYTPVSGKIQAVNQALEQHPEQVNADPYGAGWFFTVEMSDPSELDRLLDAATYQATASAH
ncbi:MAG: glycine cleavage system protein GcvH [Deinococcus sp.]|nr:glycine cleavage system protein GcvH [Deinococcus sp.]